MQDARGLDISREQIELNESIKLTLFGRVSCEPGWRGEYHSHDFWELIYIYKPKPDPFVINLNSGEHYREGSTLFLMPPGVRHIFENVGQFEAQNLYIGFTFSYQQNAASGARLPIVLPDDSAAVARTKAMLNEITAPLGSEELMQVLNNRRTDVMRCIMEVIQWISEQGSTGGVRPVDRNAALIDQIKEHIMNNLDRYISVDELAGQLYLSPNYLGQVFRQNMGMTVKNYHNQMRMEKALHTLLSGELTIGEVADKLGFESVAYFSRRFKMFYGISPSSLYRGGKQEPGLDSDEDA